MVQKDQADRVNQYLRRAKRKDVRNYPLDEKGIYEVIGGSPESGDRPSLGLLRGRFIDVVAEAIEMPGFAGWYCSAQDPGNTNNGYVVKRKDDPIKKVPVKKGLIERVTKIQELGQEKATLKERLDEIESELGGEK